MAVKEQLCKAFCDDILVREVPSGHAVSTAFAFPDGDRIGFYVRRTAQGFEIEDSGLVLPTLEASGLDLTNASRAEAFAALLREYGVEVDRDEREFRIPHLGEADVPAASLRFVSFLLRVGDLLLLSEDRVANTFRQDVARMLRERIGDRVTLEENAPLTEDLSDFPADFVLAAPGRPPVGVYLGTSDVRVLEALYMQMRLEHETRQPAAIVALLEREKSISARVRQQATNRLTAVAHFRGDEAGAITRIAREVGALNVH